MRPLDRAAFDSERDFLSFAFTRAKFLGWVSYASRPEAHIFRSPLEGTPWDLRPREIRCYRVRAGSAPLA